MVEFMFGNYPPIEDGFIRCATVQSEAMLAKLLAEGIHQPTRLETNAHSKETSRCSSCDDSSQWCWNDAYTWMYDQCALRLNLPDMDSGVWLFAHDDPERNFQEAYNHWLDKEGMVFLILDIPIERIVQSDMLLFREIFCNDPVRSLESLKVDCELPENKFLVDEWFDWHNDPSITDVEREKRKRDSWQNIFESERWGGGTYCDSCGNDSSSVVQAITPFITIDDIVDMIFPSEGMWDFLRSGEVLRVYGTLDDLSTLTFTKSGISKRRTSGNETLSMFGHQIPSTQEKSIEGIVHRRKYIHRTISRNSLKMRKGDNFRDAKLIIRRGER
jgi:hypothetical protein